MRAVQRGAAGVLLVALMTGGVVGAVGASDDEATPAIGATSPSSAGNGARLLVADGEEPVVHVVDATTGGILDSFGTLVPARVYAGPSGRYGYAVQMEADVVSVIDAGGTAGDGPALLETSLTGDKPIHFTPHGEQIGVFYDDEGVAKVFAESDLDGARVIGGVALDRPEAKPTRLVATRPHHGAAVPLGDYVLLSRPATDPEDSLPIGVDVVTMDGTIVDSFVDCPGPHGEAARGETVAVGCTDGVMLIERDGDRFASRKIAYPAGTPADVRAGYVAAADAAPFFFGNFGDDGLLRIDPEAGTAEAITLPVPVGSFDLEPGADGRLVVLTTDGRLHLLDPASGEIASSLDAVDPSGFDEEAGIEPSLVVADGTAYLSDPALGEVVRVALDAAEVDARLPLPGMPLRLALLDPASAA